MHRKVLSLVSGNALNTLLQAALGIYVARVLGPSERGLLALAMGSSLLLSTLLGFGIPHAAAYFIRNRPSSAATILRVVKGAFLLALAVSTALVFLGERTFADVFLDGMRVGSAIQFLLIGYTVMNVWNTVLGACIIARGDAGTYARAVNAGAILTCATTVLVLWGTPLRTAGVIAASLAGGVLTAVLFRRVYGGYMSYPGGGDPAVVTVGELIAYSWKSQIGALASLFFKRVDLFIVGFFLGQSSVGHYSVALSLRDAGLIVPRAVAGLVGGEMADMDVRNSGRDLQLLKRSLRYGLLFSGAAALLAVPVFPVVIPLLYGRQYVDAVFPAVYVMLSFVFLSASILLGAAISGSGRPMHLTVGNLAAATVGFAAIWLFTRQWGLAGAALSNIVSSAVHAGILLGILRFFVYGNAEDPMKEKMATF